MKRTDIKQMAFAIVTALLVASCANEDMTEVKQLPEGKYPVVINAVNVTDNAQTRVSESADGISSAFDWDGSETIGVSIDGGGFFSEYTLNKDNTISSTSPLYWSNTAPTVVSSYYPYIDTLDLSDQTAGLKYVMKGEGVGGFAIPVHIDFKHQLAKVRVKIIGAKDAVASVGVYGYTSCINTNGNVTLPDNATQGYISMRKSVEGGEYWEANVVPGSLNQTAFLQINGTTMDVKTEVSTLEAGKCYNFEITVDEKRTKAVANDDGSYTINAGDTVYIEKTLTGTIHINGIADVELRNVVASVKAPIIVHHGTATIRIKGTNNVLTAKEGSAGILLENKDSHVSILGIDSINSKLKIIKEISESERFYFSPGIGGLGQHEFNGHEWGNIRISNIDLTVDWEHSVEGGIYGAAIGMGGDTYGSYGGNIIIENSRIEATSSETSVIGMGANMYSSGRLGDIIISDTKLFIKVTGLMSLPCIGSGYFQAREDDKIREIGRVSITSKEDPVTFFGADRFQSDQENTMLVGGYVWGLYSWQGVEFNGIELKSKDDRALYRSDLTGGE